MPNTNGHGPKTAVLYARVSTEEQAKTGYSIPEQLRELRSYAAREGYRVVEEVVDDGHSGADPHRPGLRRVMGLAAAGSMEAVLAKKRNRLFRSRLYRLLWDQDLGELGVKLIALDDAGNALEVSEAEMEVVPRIFRSVAEGASVRSVRLSLEREGVIAPSGIVRWNHTTIRNILGSSLYAPHTAAEVAEVVEPAVAARLEEGRSYGLWAWNTKKSTRRKEWDESAGEFKVRYTKTTRPREEWLFVPVPAAGIPAEGGGRARQSPYHNPPTP